MENAIIVAIILLLAAAGVRASVKHFRGQGGCCGGGGYKVKKKKLPQVIATKTFRVEGMHCDHCKARVEEEVNDIPGAAGVVDLKRGELTVSYARDIGDDVIRQKVEKAGYTLVEPQ